VIEGCDASFTVVATSASSLSYQWRKDDADILGATNDALIVQNVKPAQNNQRYSVVVSNAVGPVTSSNAVLTVSADIAPPMINVQPQSQVIVMGTNVTFTLFPLSNALAAKD